jgi:hypothetical protein
LHRVTGAVLRLLENGDGVKRFDNGRNLFRLMTDDDNGFAGFQRSARPNNLFDKRAATGAVQNFSEIGLQAGALACGKNDDS